MTRIAIAGFAHETNTFSPIPTTFESFSGGKDSFTGFYSTDQINQYRGKKVNIGSIGFFTQAEKFGYECIATMGAETSPSAEVQINAFDRIMDMILELIEKSKPLDGVLLDLHGAMVLEGYKLKSPNDSVKLLEIFLLWLHWICMAIFILIFSK